jgi:hypothetical protein
MRQVLQLRLAQLVLNVDEPAIKAVVRRNERQLLSCL